MSAFGSLSTTEETVRCHGEPLPLTGLEFAILHAMVTRQADRSHDLTPMIVLQNAVAAKVPKSTAESNVLQVMICRIRRKLEAAGAGVSIGSVRGQGYRLVLEQAVAA